MYRRAVVHGDGVEQPRGIRSSDVVTNPSLVADAMRWESRVLEVRSDACNNHGQSRIEPNRAQRSIRVSTLSWGSALTQVDSSRALWDKAAPPLLARKAGIGPTSASRCESRSSEQLPFRISAGQLAKFTVLCITSLTRLRAGQFSLLDSTFKPPFRLTPGLQHINRIYSGRIDIYNMANKSKKRARDAEADGKPSEDASMDQMDQDSNDDEVSCVGKNEDG